MRKLGWGICLVASLTALGGCSSANHAGRPANQSTPPPVRPTAAPTIAVRTPPPPTPASSAASGPPSAAQAATPKPTPPKLASQVLRLSSDAPPQILGVAMSETTVRPGDTVSGNVLTTSNVASVQARIGGYALNLSKLGVGRFAITYTLAPMPFFIRGNFTLLVIARNTRGDTVTRAIPITVR